MAEHKMILDVEEYTELKRKATKYDFLVMQGIRTVNKKSHLVTKQNDGSFLVEMAYWDIEKN